MAYYLQVEGSISVAMHGMSIYVKLLVRLLWSDFPNTHPIYVFYIN